MNNVFYIICIIITVIVGYIGIGRVLCITYYKYPILCTIAWPIVLILDFFKEFRRFIRDEILK